MLKASQDIYKETKIDELVF